MRVRPFHAAVAAFFVWAAVAALHQAGHLSRLFVPVAFALGAAAVVAWAYEVWRQG